MAAFPAVALACFVCFAVLAGFAVLAVLAVLAGLAVPVEGRGFAAPVPRTPDSVRVVSTTVDTAAVLAVVDLSPGAGNPASATGDRPWAALTPTNTTPVVTPATAANRHVVTQVFQFIEVLHTRCCGDLTSDVIVVDGAPARVISDR